MFTYIKYWSYAIQTFSQTEFYYFSDFKFYCASLYYKYLNKMNNSTPSIFFKTTIIMYEVKYIREYDPCARFQKKEINIISTQRLQTLSKTVRLNSFRPVPLLSFFVDYFCLQINIIHDCVRTISITILAGFLVTQLERVLLATF